MKNKSGLVFTIFMVVVLTILYFFIDSNEDNVVINYLFFALVIVIGLYVITLLINRKKNIKSKSKDKLFNSLVNSSDTIYIMLNEDKKIIYVSSNVEDVLGIKSNNKTDEQVVYEILNIPIIKNELKNWDSEKEYVSQMIEYNHSKYNHNIWIKIKVFPYKEKKNSYSVLQIVDATKEHDRQHLLVSQASDIKAREIKLNQITSSSYDMEINVNLSNNTYDFKYFKLDNKYFGEERRGIYTEFLNNLINNFINKNDKDIFVKNLSIDKLEEKFIKYEIDPIVFRYRVGNESKNNTWLESTIFFISNKGNKTISILTKNVTGDAESIREQNYMLQNALNDVKLADQSKTDLISTISHDIRTPLTSIMGLSESLLTKKISKEIKEDIKNIKTSSKELLTIIDSLLDTNKIEKQIIEKEEKPYNIFRMFKIVEDNAKEFINTKDIKLNINMSNNLPVILNGDCVRITKAITTIVNNSIKYTNDGEININVNGIKKDNFVDIIIEISDNGIGMSSEKLNEIINSKSAKGITSVKNLMNILDGKLEIESKENEYTKVTLTFKQKIITDNKVRLKLEKNKTTESFELEGKKILIVDDNKLNLKVTNRLLEPYKVDTTLVESGIEALEIIEDNNIYDLILLDQMMPSMDGTTTLSKLKEIKDFNTPVVVLTADAIKGRKEVYLNDGFDDYISKPIDKKELNRVLEKFLKDGSNLNE